METGSGWGGDGSDPPSPSVPVPARPRPARPLHRLLPGPQPAVPALLLPGALQVRWRPSPGLSPDLMSRLSPQADAQKLSPPDPPEPVGEPALARDAGEDPGDHQRSVRYLEALTVLPVSPNVVPGSPSVCPSRPGPGVPGRPHQRPGAAARQPGVPQQSAAGGTQSSGSGCHHVRSWRNRPGKTRIYRPDVNSSQVTEDLLLLDWVVDLLTRTETSGTPVCR